MAVNESGYMNGNLRSGITDGAVKKIAPDRGGEVEYDAHDAIHLQEQYNMRYSSGTEYAIARRVNGL